LRIALDAMGGDHAPEVPLKAARDLASVPGLELVLLGPEQVLRGAVPPNVTIRDAPETVAMDEHATAALRQKRASSIAVGIEMVGKGEAQAFVSAGNTGAIMAAALMGLGRQEGVDRPALAVPFPTDRGVSLLLDAGANADAKPAYLVQFARLGVEYARKALSIERPRVALLNIGEEAGKGNQLARESYDLLRESGLDFVGNVEGKDLPKGLADVIVTDGFTGNVVLKVAEGVSESLVSSLRTALTSRWHYKLAAGVLRPAFRSVARRLDYSEYGGAPLLGVRGTVIIGHGRSDSRAIYNAVLVAMKAAT